MLYKFTFIIILITDCGVAWWAKKWVGSAIML